MTRRYLFGPVTTEFAEQNLYTMRQAGQCQAFDYRGDADISITALETWESLSARLPAGWHPDFLVLDLAYRTIPPALWSAPVPIIALASDWNWLWHGFRLLLPYCDLVFADTAGVDALRRAGFDRALPANLYGLPRAYLEAPPPDNDYAVDILFVGNLHSAVQRERLSWLGRLAALADRYRVTITSGVYGDHYRALLRRSRIVFNRSVRGECNQRTLEATACGALLFQEHGNASIAAHFRDRQDCICYGDEDLEQLLDYYLTHEEERRAIAESGRRRALELSYAFCWGQVLEQVEQQWPLLQQRAARRPPFQGADALLARVEQAANSMDRADRTLPVDLEAAVADAPNLPALRNALGVALGIAGQVKGVVTAPAAQQAATYFRQALTGDPRNPVAALNLIEAVADGEQAEAAKGAWHTLALLARTGEWPVERLSAPRFPAGFDLFHVEWERAAWANAGRPGDEARAKVALLRWRLHTLRAELTGDLVHFHEAALARPDLPAARAALGCALGRAKRPLEAIPHLRFAVAANPFDAAAARALFQAFVDIGDAEEQRRFIHQRRLLRRAATQRVAPEDWFAATPAPAFSPAAPPCRLVWEGPLRAAHSLGLVSRELCRGLLRRGHEVSLLPTDPPLPAQDLVALEPALAERAGRPLSGEAEVHVRQQWPPDSTPPPAGRWVVLQAWEYGSIPRVWLSYMARRVDEVWAPSRFVRDCFVQAGVPADRVHVTPHGIDPIRFHPGAPPRPLKTRKSFKFLFVGGTIFRKGIDILLAAYGLAFTRRDDVCLVIKDMGVGTFYRGQTAEERIAQVQQNADAPEIEYLSENLDEDALAGLYTACDCLVHPYRGEGFGLPILEALGCGRPAVVTGYGAALDFCDERCGYLLPARIVRFSHKRVGDIETVDHPWLAEPDVGALGELLRHVARHPEEARVRGEAGRARVHAEWTWERAAAVVEDRLRALRQQPIRRTETTRRRGETANKSAAPVEPIQVSLCLIVKNEEKNLPACLESVADLVNEIVVVDTGSTDQTKAVAARFGAKVVDFPWIDSFSAARNESLRHASGQWIFWMDADDRLDAENRDKLRALFTTLKPENAAYSMKCLCLPDAETGTATVVDHIRLFRNDPALCWEHRVHEQILPAIRRLGAEVRWADVVVHHAGYQDAALRTKKLQRDIRLLELERGELGDHPFTLFNLGSVYQELGRHADALTVLRRSLDLSHPSDSIVRKLYALIVICHRAQGRLAEALTACQEGRRLYPADAELLFAEALLRRDQQDLDGAAACLQQLLTSKPGAHFASVDAGLRGYKARQNLGVIYRQQGKLAEAEQQWQAVVAERADFLPAWLALGELYLSQQRWPDLEEAAQRMTTRPQGMMEAAVLRARAELAQRHFAAARQRLEQAIGEHPQALWPRVILSHVLLQEGSDLAAAEAALRSILALDPQHTEARNNLAVLLRQRDRHAADSVFAGNQMDLQP